MIKNDLLFLVSDSDKTHISYSTLLMDISEKNSIPKYLYTNNLYELYLNLLTALVHNKDVVVLDSDFSSDEIKKFTGNTEVLNIDYTLEKKIVSFSNIKKLLAESASKITLFTSGTTGQPKEVAHTAKRFISFTKQGDRFSQNIWALAYNPTHMAGLQVFFQCIMNLNTIINIYRDSKKNILSIAEKYTITHISATPTFYRMLLPCDFSLPKVANITIGGEKSDDVLFNNLQKMFPAAKLTNIYASTEAGSLFYSDGNIFTIQPHLSDKIKIEGSKLYLSKNLLGESNSISNEAWYDTGDVVEIISEKPVIRFKFLSRSNEMINVGGNKVNPNEIENILLSFSGIKNAIVFGKQNSVLGNMLVAEIEANQEINIHEIRKELSNKLQEYKVPRIIKIVEKIETTRTGKLKRIR